MSIIASAKFLVIGHSHLGAIESAYNEYFKKASFQMRFLSLMDSTGGAKHTFEDAKHSIESANFKGIDYVITCITGNQHNILGLFDYPEKFDFVFPGESDEINPTDSERIFLPFSAVQRIMDGKVRKILPHMELIQQKFSKPIINIDAPPPIQESIIMKRPGVFRQKVDAGTPFAPIHLRYKLWKLQCLCIRRFCNQINIPTLAFPKRLLAGSLLLPEVYAAGDPTHANKLYGKAMIKRIVNYTAQNKPA